MDGVRSKRRFFLGGALGWRGFRSESTMSSLSLLSRIGLALAAIWAEDCFVPFRLDFPSSISHGNVRGMLALRRTGSSSSDTKWDAFYARPFGPDCYSLGVQEHRA